MSVHSMRPFGLTRLVALSLAGLGLAEPLRAQDDPAELAQARGVFQKEMEFATRPIRERYLSRLETLKRSLGARGDARGAAAVQDEIDRLKASVATAQEALARLAGIWQIEYKLGSGYTRRYVIKPDGGLLWDEELGKPFGPRKGKVTVKGAEYRFEIEGGAVERVWFTGGGLMLECFNTKASLEAGVPVNTATGKKVVKP